jgi:hypothetical protein
VLKSRASVHDWFARAVIAIAAAGVFAVGVRHGTFAAADTDPYGYISEAEAFANGRLQLDQRALQDVPWPNAEATFSPPGWRPAPTPGFIVPIYSPGLPLVMAGYQRVLGRQGVFYAVPVLAALAVLAIGRLGTILHGSFVGASSALLLATSPTLLRHVVQPVSDVPTMAWWTLSLALATAGGSAAALGAGLSASMAILTRPNLVPLAAIVGVLALLPRTDEPKGGLGMRRTLWFAGGVLPGCVAVAVINWMSSGSPLLSGYGTLGYLYSLNNVLQNLDRYPRWIWEQESSLLYLGVFAPLAFHWWPHGRTPSVRPGPVYALLSFAAAVLSLYLPFSVFGRNEWDYLRFMLPGIPVLTVLGMMVAVEGTRRLMPQGTRVAARILAPLLLILGVQHVWWAAHYGAFAAAIADKRYPDVGRYVAEAMPRDAVFVSGLHNGTIRYYANRVTIRYDLFEPDWLDRAISYMKDHGHPAYIVVEEGEEPIFKDRFAASSEFGKLDWPPAVERFEPVRVRIYDPADRARYMAGDPIVTGDIGFVGTPRITSRK